MESLQIDALPLMEGGEITLKERGYLDRIVAYLKMQLRLPDYGAVKLKLTLDRTGKVIQVQILQSESEKNKQYMERELPKLAFPPFGNQFEGLTQYSMTITFSN